MAHANPGPEDFLQTILLVDDQADTAAMDETTDTSFSSRTVVDGFAELGLNCAVLAAKTSAGEDLVRVTRLARKTDVVILDWTLNPGGSGPDKDSMPLLTAIVREDLSRGGRLRLIVFYTGNEKVQNILSDVQEELSDLHIDAALDLADRSVTADFLKVVVVAKQTRAGDEAAVAADKLPAEVKRIFSEAFGSGLLRRVALTSVAAVRDQTHRLLATFSSDIDEAYLSHRTLAGAVPAESFARQLIGDGILTVLADAHVERWVEQDEIDAALLKRFPEEDVPDDSSGLAEASPDEVAGAVATPAAGETVEKPSGPIERLMPKNLKGTEFYAVTSTWARETLSQTRFVELSSGPTPKWGSVSSLVSLFQEDGDQAAAIARTERAEDGFAILSTFARHCGQPRRTGEDPPNLGLGTVLERGGSYILCMQPLCDSARLTEGVPEAFPMSPLDVVLDATKSFDLLLPGRNNIRVKFAIKLNRIRMLHFAPTYRGAVQAQLDGDVYRFKPDREDAFVWIGQLRLDHAHRFTSQLGISASRMGLDEPEWARRRAERR